MPGTLRTLGGSASLRAFLPIWNAAGTIGASTPPTTDTGSLIASATYQGPGLLRLNTQNPGTIGLLPNQMAVWEATSVLDGYGQPVGVDNMDLGDIIMPLIRAPNIIAPVDVIIAAGVSKGPVAAGNPGICVTIRDTKGSGGTTVANQWTTGHGSGTVGAWSQFVSSATDLNCIQAILNPGMSTQFNQSKINAEALDLSHSLCTLPSALSSSGVANAVGEYDRFWIGFGYVTGVGGSALTNFDFGASLLFLRGFDTRLMDPFGGTVQGQPAADSVTAFIFGQSNAAGSHEDDTTFTVGSGVSANYTIIGTGSTYATWPAHSATDGVGPAPYLAQTLVTNGVVHPILVRRARTATAMQALLEVDFRPGIADHVSLGKAPSHVILIHGEEDSKLADTANQYLVALRRWRDLVRGFWPGCRIIITKLRTTTYGAFYATVQAAQAQFAAETSNCAFVVTDGFTLAADAIHYSVGTGGGFDQLGQAIAAVW